MPEIYKFGRWEVNKKNARLNAQHWSFKIKICSVFFPLVFRIDVWEMFFPLLFTKRNDHVGNQLNHLLPLLEISKFSRAHKWRALEACHTTSHTFIWHMRRKCVSSFGSIIWYSMSYNDWDHFNFLTGT